MTESRPRRGRPPKSPEADGRDRLLLAARHAFARDGYSAANVNAIATAAGVNPPTLYHHFHNKEGLFVAAATQAYLEVLDALRSSIADVGTDFHAAIDRVLTASITLVTEEPSLARMFLTIQYEVPRNPVLATELSPLLREFRDFFDTIAAHAPGGSAPQFTGRALVALLNGLNTEALLMNSPQRDYRKLVNATKDLLGVEPRD